LEHVHVSALCVLRRRLGLTVEREVPFEIVYSGVPLSRRTRSRDDSEMARGDTRLSRFTTARAN
jgi:hypothetical protein